MKKMVRYSYFLLFICFVSMGKLFSYPSADLSFLVADLKYNKEQGVKICEIQLGRISKFSGSAFVRNDELYLANRLFQIFCLYSNDGWFCQGDICDKQIPLTFQEKGWSIFDGPPELFHDSTFKRRSKKGAHDPFNLFDYQGILYVRNEQLGSIKKFHSSHPGVIILDKAVETSCVDKASVSSLFQGDKDLERFRPKSKLYKKKYHSLLSKTIKEDIHSDIYVIKPIRGVKGRGVIIVRQEELEETLRLIFVDHPKAKSHSDPAVQYWIQDKSEQFLVEEYVPSDPVAPSHLDSRPFDGTMRVVFVLAYQNQEIEISFVDKYWKLPEYSLHDQGSLNELHKSCGKTPYFAAVDSDTDESVEELMTEGMKLFYKKILSLPQKSKKQ